MTLVALIGQWARYQQALVEYEKQFHRKCKHCRQHFQAERIDAKYCSDACRQAQYRRRSAKSARSPVPSTPKNAHSARLANPVGAIANAI